MKVNLPINHKSVNLSIKGYEFSEEERIITFYGAVWNNKDAANDILVKGCCAKSIIEHGPGSTSPQKILMLAYHDLSRPIGKFISIEEDEYGLLCKAMISDTKDGNEVIQLIKDGVINQFSIGFRYIWDKVKYDSETDTYFVYEIKLMEVSAVSIGINELTQVKGEESIKALELKAEALLKDLSPNIAMEVRQLMADYYALGINSHDVKSTIVEEPQDHEAELIQQLKQLKEKLTKN